MSDLPGDITGLLHAWSNGSTEAFEKLVPMVYDELRKTAKKYLDSEDPRHTLQPTALVNEVYLRLTGSRTVQWNDRLQFYGFAAQLMRRILVDHARAKKTEKRGEGVRPISIEALGDIALRQDEALVALDEALKSLEAEDERQSRIVEMKFFAGLSHEEIGEVLGISVRTVKREWRTARLWLFRKIGG